MRRAVLVAVLASATAFTTACSSSSLFGDDSARATAVPTANPAGPMPSSQQFDRPFPVAGEDWDATVTLSGLRIVPSSAHADRIVGVDVRAVQSSGQPEIGPADVTAFDPAGQPFGQIADPAGTVDDPLVPSVITSQGQAIEGMVAWAMPDGARIGRIDVVTPGTDVSVTVTRQPVDPMATQAQAQPAT